MAVFRKSRRLAVTPKAGERERNLPTGTIRVVTTKVRASDVRRVGPRRVEIPTVFPSSVGDEDWLQTDARPLFGIRAAQVTVN